MFHSFIVLQTYTIVFDRIITFSPDCTIMLSTVFVAYNIIEDDREVAILLSYAGEKLNDIVDTFSEEDL